MIINHIPVWEKFFFRSESNIRPSANIFLAFALRWTISNALFTRIAISQKSNTLHRILLPSHLESVVYNCFLSLLNMPWIFFYSVLHIIVTNSKNFIYKRTVEPLNFHFKRIQSEIFNLFWSFFYHHVPNITMNWKNKETNAPVIVASP